MITLNKVFDIERAKSDAFWKYNSGDVAFITNWDIETSFLGYIEPLENDKVFHKSWICLTSFGNALIHKPPFLPRWNWWSWLLVLIPKHEMTEEELYSYAAQINLQQWKFSFSRMAIFRRIEKLPLKEYSPNINISVEKKKLIPKKKKSKNTTEFSSLKLEPVSKYCVLSKKTSIPQSQMELGTIPYVTTSSKNNWISGFVDEEAVFDGKCLTVALNGSVWETFFQMESFITSWDNAVLTLKGNYNVYLLIYIAWMIRRDKWRYNYYRKLSGPKLEKMKIPMPFTKENDLDLKYIENIVKGSYGFKEIEQYLNIS